MVSGLDQLTLQLHALADPARAKNLAWFFKTKPGQYGAGDKFIGLKVPQIRQEVKNILPTKKLFIIFI